MAKYLIVSELDFKNPDKLLNQTSSPMIAGLSPGAHVAVISPIDKQHLVGIKYRLIGLEYRDEISILGANFLIILFRKDCSEKTVAKNIMRHGTGAVNIEQTRIGTTGARTNANTAKDSHIVNKKVYGDYNPIRTEVKDYGRFPSNIILLNVGSELDKQSGTLNGGSFPTKRSESRVGFGVGQPTEGGARTLKDKGGASRFFFNAKTEQEVFNYIEKLINPDKKED